MAIRVQDTGPLVNEHQRDSVHVMADMLRAAGDGVRMSRIFQLANVNHVRGTRYLDALIEAGLLVENEGRYTPTDRGRKFLSHWRQIESCFEPA